MTTSATPAAAAWNGVARATDFETAALPGEANVVFPNFTGNRFFGPRAPSGGWSGIRNAM